jgi:hypothetical protein
VVTVGLGAGNNTYTTSFESTKNNGTAERNSSGNILQIKETYTGQTPVGYSQTRGAILKLRANTSSGSLDTEGYVQAFIINSGSSDYTTRDQMGFRTNKAFVFKATDTSWPLYFAVQGGPSNNLKTLLYSGQQDGGLLQLKANNAKTTKITFADTSALPGTNGYYRYISGGNTGNLVLGRKLSGGSEEAYITMSGVGGYAGNIAVGVNQGTPTATLHVTGSGLTNGTTAFLVEDSDGNDIIKALDDRTFGLGYNGVQITNSVSGNESVRINDRSGAPLMKIGVSSGSAAAINMCNGYYNTFSYTTVGGMVYTNAAGVNVSQDAASMFTLISTTKGMLPPRMTTTQRDAINSGTFTTGLTLYNTTTNKLQFYNGTAWTDAGGGGDNIYTADGTLSGNRTVTMGTNTLSFNSSSAANTNTALTFNGTYTSTTGGVGATSGGFEITAGYGTKLKATYLQIYSGATIQGTSSGNLTIHSTVSNNAGYSINARLGVIGKSATSTTDYAFRVQDSVAADMLTVRDDGAIAIGKSASYTNSTPNTSVIIGTSALVTSNNSVVIGASATTGFGGNYNTVVGAGAKVANNTSFGLSIGYGAEGTGTNSVAIGYSSKAAGNGLAIGRDAEATGSKSINLNVSGATATNSTTESLKVFMTSSAAPDLQFTQDNSYWNPTGETPAFGFSTTSPTATVDINGTFRLRAATNVNGKVLTADANGNGTWQTAGGGSSGPAISIENTNGGDVDLYDDNIVRLWLDDGSSDDIELEITNYASSTSSTYHVNYTNFEGGASSARTTTVDLNQSGATSISTLDFSFTDDECMKLRIWSPRLGLGVGGSGSGFPFYEITIVKSGSLYTGAPVITSVIKSTS